MVNQAQTLYTNHFSDIESSKPVFMSLNLETPLGLATFLANNFKHQKVYIPSTFSMNQILQGLKNQQSTVVVCDKELYELEPPQKHLEELQKQVNSVKKVVVASSGKLGKSTLFSQGDVSSVDPLKF